MNLGLWPTWQRWIALCVVLILMTIASTYVAFHTRISEAVHHAIVDFIEKKVNEQIHAISEGKLNISIEGFRYGFFSGEVIADTIHVVHQNATHASAPTFVATIVGFSATGVYPWDVLFGEGLRLGTITVHQSQLLLNRSDQSDSSLSQRNKLDQFQLPRIPNVDSLIENLAAAMLPRNISPLRIQNIHIGNSSIVLVTSRSRTDTIADTTSMHGIRVAIGNVNLGKREHTSRTFSRVSIDVDSLYQTREHHATVHVRGFGVVVSDADSAMSIDTVRYVPSSEYLMHLSGLHFSFRDQRVSIAKLEAHPKTSDDLVFLRTLNADKFSVSLSNVKLFSMNLTELAKGTALRARSAHIDSVYFNIRSIKTGFHSRSRSKPIVLHELVQSVPFCVKVDSVVVHNGAIVYGERHRYSSALATLRWNSLNGSLVHVYTSPHDQRGKPLTANVRGMFMDQAPMSATIVIPLDSLPYTMKASGTMGVLDLTRLNSFLPIAENIRITDGKAAHASFSFVVRGRRATGIVDATYSDLKVQLLNEQTKETGFFNTIASFIANWIVIRTSNQPGKRHKVGAIRYVLPKDANVMQTLWFPIRDGLGDLSGF